MYSSRFVLRALNRNNPNSILRVVRSRNVSVATNFGNLIRVHGQENIVGCSVARRSMVVVTQTSSNSSAEGNSNIEQNQEKPPSSSSLNLETNLGDSATDTNLIITPSCAKQIITLAQKRNQPLDEVFLRVYVDAGGCSGFTYQFELDTEMEEEDDVVFSLDGGARLVVDQTSLGYIRGSTIDYVQEMIKSGFSVKDNPLSESACGCGSSFALKNFAANPALD